MCSCQLADFVFVCVAGTDGMVRAGSVQRHWRTFVNIINLII